MAAYGAGRGVVQRYGPAVAGVPDSAVSQIQLDALKPDSQVRRFVDTVASAYRVLELRGIGPRTTDLLKSLSPKLRSLCE